MRFTSYFEPDFLIKEHIVLKNVKCSEGKKSFCVYLQGDKLLDIASFKKLVAGITKISSLREFRKYTVEFYISYNDLRTDESKLYIDYFRTILTEVNVDYDLLMLSNYNVLYENSVYTITLNDLNKVNDRTLEKAIQLFSKFGLQVEIKKVSIDKEAVLEIKKEIKETEEAEIKKTIEQNKEVEEKKKQIETAQKKSKYVRPNTLEAVEPIVNIPTTQLGLDEHLNKNGSLSFTIEGHIFNIEYSRLPKSELYQLSITDGTDSILIKKFVKTEADKEAFAALKNGDVIRVTGNATNDTYAREVVLQVTKFIYIGVKEEKTREDKGLTKRVELHLHTNMSALDAICDVKDYVNMALKWGHKAIAFTDHDGVYSYHDIMVATQGKDIKPIYGVELGLVDEKKFNIAYTSKDIDLRNATYVVFDIETTGFSVTYDRIIQIAARKVLQGQVIETFESFVNPEMPIPGKITELTSITDEMVSEALTINDVLPKFIDFIGDAILVAQNASFDVGHIYENMKRLGIPYKEFPVIDTMQLARNFYFKELKTFNLKSLARFFKVQQEHHHLADDDTRVTTEIFLQMLQTLYKHNIYNYQDINNCIYLEEAFRHIFPRHVTLLVKNQTGYTRIIIS